MQRIEEEIFRLRNNGTRHLQQSCIILSQPRSSQLLRDLELRLPMFWKACRIDSCYIYIGPFNLEQGELRWNVVCGSMCANL